MKVLRRIVLVWQLARLYRLCRQYQRSSGGPPECCPGCAGLLDFGYFVNLPN